MQPNGTAFLRKNVDKVGYLHPKLFQLKTTTTYHGNSPAIHSELSPWVTTVTYQLWTPDHRCISCSRSTYTTTTTDTTIRTMDQWWIPHHSFMNMLQPGSSESPGCKGERVVQGTSMINHDDFSTVDTEFSTLCWHRTWSAWYKSSNVIWWPSVLLKSCLMRCYRICWWKS